MYSDPMPGENYENAAERERAAAERRAIDNGENFNPNLSEEAAEGFGNLGSEVPFAGEDAPVEYGSEAGAAPDTPGSEGEETVVGKTIAAHFEAGVEDNLEDVKSSIEGNYDKDATNQVFNNPSAISANAEVISKTNLDEEKELADGNPEVQVGEQPKEAAVAAGEMAIGLMAEAEKAAANPAQFDQSQFEIKRQQTQKVIDSIPNAISNNADSTEAEISRGLQQQAQEMTDKAEELVQESTQKLEGMSEEDKQKVEGIMQEDNTASFDDAYEQLQKEAEDEAAKKAEIDTIVQGGIYSV
ncbi:hypothetical protein IKX12_00145 [Candidatus Saccharibacteria bacterium]|nr:hypothetical protein [Candidatus Saccharibacteria bacterium]